MKLKLTDSVARRLGPGIYWDTHADAPRGFGLRVTTALSRSWFLNYRLRDTGRERRITIADVATMPVEMARGDAAELRRAVLDGGDPLEEIEQRRAAPTVAELVARFEQEELPQLAAKTQVDYRIIFKKYILPALGRLKVAAVTREDIERLHRAITAQGKAFRANRAKTLCSSLFNRAIVWKWRAENDNPTRLVKANREPPRERDLKPEEFERLFVELDRWQQKRPDTCDVIRLAIATGARRGEILRMRWHEVDLDGATWTKPAATTKQRKLHYIPLNTTALEVLRRRDIDRRNAAQTVVQLRPQDEPDFVFKGGGNVGHVGRINADWNQIRAAAHVGDVRFHDLRHAFAGLCVSQGLSLPIVGALLGHRAARTTQRYARLQLDPLREASERVGDVINAAMVKK